MSRSASKLPSSRDVLVRAHRLTEPNHETIRAHARVGPVSRLARLVHDAGTAVIAAAVMSAAHILAQHRVGLQTEKAIAKAHGVRACTVEAEDMLAAWAFLGVTVSEDTRGGMSSVRTLETDASDSEAEQEPEPAEEERKKKKKKQPEEQDE